MVSNWLHKLLFFVISISFFISAAEMDLGECHNTFFDEHDTYIRSDLSSFTQHPVEHQTRDTYFLLHGCSDCEALRLQLQTVCGYFFDYNKHHPPKLYLQNSDLRI